jgi:hypothetical protein
MSDDLNRLRDGYYNSDGVSAANPGGLDDGGHEINLPALLMDVGAVAQQVGVDATQVAADRIAVADAATAVDSAKTLALGYRDAAAISAANAAGLAAGLHLPAISAADAGRTVVIKADGSGYQVGAVAAAADLSNVTNSAFAVKAASAGVAANLGVRKAGLLIGSRPTINLSEGMGTTVTVADDGANNRVNITIAVTSPSTVTLDPAAKGADITLSNGNLTATPNGHTGRGGVRVSAGKMSGKYYFEAVGGFRESTGVGFAASAIDMVNVDIRNAVGASFINGEPNGLAYITHDGVNASLTGVNPYGDKVISIACDIDARKWWYAVNGVWQQTGDPIAGINTLAYFPTAATIYPMLHIRNFAGETVTIRFAYNQWMYAPPTGFGQWG